MNRYQKLLYAAAFSTLIAGGISSTFSASADVANNPATAVEGSGKAAGADARSSHDSAPSSYSLHSALLRAPASPAVLPLR